MVAGGAAGGFVGALLVVLVAVYFLRRQHRRRWNWADRRVGVIDDDSDAGDEYPAGAIRPDARLEHYQPTPLVLEGEHYSLGPSASSLGYTPLETVHDSSASAAAESSSSVRSGGKRRTVALRATTRVVSYVLHDDAGLELETIEMPPAYADLRRGRGAAAERGGRPSNITRGQLAEKGRVVRWHPAALLENDGQEESVCR